jgi:uncharacterized RDD family membrane protein YckC
MTDNLYAPPKSHVADMGNDAGSFEYVGFWPRVGAALLDAVIQMVFTIPLLMAIYGRSYMNDTSHGPIHGPAEVFISYVMPAVAIIAFWVMKQATPGKMLIGAKIVDAKTGGPLTVWRAIGRYLAYIPSYLVFCLGIIWVGIDAKKQGWHDKLAGTLVVKVR